MTLEPSNCCQEVIQLFNKLFPTDAFRSSYLENRSRRMEVGSKVLIVDSDKQKEK